MVRKKPRVVESTAHLVGDDLYIQIIVLDVQPSPLYPGGTKYSFTLVDIKIGGRVFAIDNYGGHGHHMHIGEEVRHYRFLGLQKLRADFWAYVEEYKRNRP